MGFALISLDCFQEFKFGGNSLRTRAAARRHCEAQCEPLEFSKASANVLICAQSPRYPLSPT